MAKVGGYRPGAGRKKGTANKKTREIADRAAAEGITPLEFMLRVMRDEKEDLQLRADMAKSAAPYIHPRLQSTMISGPNGGQLQMEVNVRFVNAN